MNNEETKTAEEIAKEAAEKAASETPKAEEPKEKGWIAKNWPWVAGATVAVAAAVAGGWFLCGKKDEASSEDTSVADATI